MRRLLLVLCFALLPCWAASAASSVASSWSTGPYPLTDGATIPVPCPGQADANGVGVSGVYYLTLTGSNHKILFPTCPATSNGQTVRFRINSGNNTGAPYTGLTFAAGFNWTGTNPYASCTAVSAPNPACPGAQVVSQIDEFGCDIIGTTASSTEWDCWTPQYAIAAPPAYTVVVTGHGANCLNTATCLGPSLQSVTSGTNILVTMVWCGNTGVTCTGNGATSATSAVPTKSAGTATITTCVALTGAVASETTSGFAIKTYQCPVTVSGTLTMTDTLGGTAPHAMQLSVSDISGLNSTPDLDAIGNGATGTTSVTATTTGNTSQSSEFIFAGGTGNAFNQGSPGSGYTALDSDNTGIQFLTEYKVSGASGSAQSATLTAASGTSVAIISALAHP